jgi:hypothetical protein
MVGRSAAALKRGMVGQCTIGATRSCNVVRERCRKAGLERERYNTVGLERGIVCTMQQQPWPLCYMIWYEQQTRCLSALVERGAKERRDGEARLGGAREQ